MRIKNGKRAGALLAACILAVTEAVLPQTALTAHAQQTQTLYELTHGITDGAAEGSAVWITGIPEAYAQEDVAVDTSALAGALQVFGQERIGSRAAFARAKKNAVTIKQTMYVNQVAQWRVDPDHKRKWKSSKKSVATVNSYGVITAKKPGKTKITVKISEVNYTCNLTVKKSNFKPVAMEKLANYQYFKKYMSDSEFRQAYNKALKIVKPLGDLSREDQLYGVASALRKIAEEDITYSMSAPHYNDPYGYFVLGVSSCAGCTRATGLCLNILGIEYEHVNENQYKHQWCRVKVGNEYWICDAFGMYCGKEPGVRKHPYVSD